MNATLDILVWALLSAAGAVGLTIILRNAPGIRNLVSQAKKPWACNDCMPLYTVPVMLAVPIWQTGDWNYLIAYLPAYALANVALKRMGRPPGPPHIPKEFLS